MLQRDLGAEVCSAKSVVQHAVSGIYAMRIRALRNFAGCAVHTKFSFARGVMMHISFARGVMHTRGLMQEVPNKSIADFGAQGEHSHQLQDFLHVSQSNISDLCSLSYVRFMVFCEAIGFMSLHAARFNILF